MAKRFFYVCAGLLCLALTYHLGARSATAQAPGGVECVDFSEVIGTAVIDHELWIAENSSPIYVHKFQGGPIPSPARAIASAKHGVVLENGEVWRNNNGFWEFSGTLPIAGTVPTTEGSWGALKVRYRGERQPQGVKTPTNR